MEEEQKKRNRKRKGLGGLDKEKKNKLKVGHFLSESRSYSHNQQNPEIEFLKKKKINDLIPVFFFLSLTTSKCIQMLFFLINLL